MLPVVVMRNAIPLTQTDVCVHLVDKCITLLVTATWFFIKMRTTTGCATVKVIASWNITDTFITAAVIRRDTNHPCRQQITFQRNCSTIFSSPTPSTVQRARRRFAWRMDYRSEEIRPRPERDRTSDEKNKTIEYSVSFLKSTLDHLVLQLKGLDAAPAYCDC